MRMLMCIADQGVGRYIDHGSMHNLTNASYLPGVHRLPYGTAQEDCSVESSLQHDKRACRNVVIPGVQDFPALITKESFLYSLWRNVEEFVKLVRDKLRVRSSRFCIQRGYSTFR